MGEQLAGRERSDRHHSEHQKIVEGLHLVSFLRPVRLQHQCRGTDKGEVPADTEHDQRRPEMHRGDAGQTDRRPRGFQNQSQRNDFGRTEARDQRAGEEARPVHRHDVPLNAEIGIADREPAHLHGERRRGHHQVHHRVSDHPAHRRRNEARLPRDLEQRPAAMVDAGQHRHRHQRDEGLHHEAEGEQIRRPDIHGPLHELWTEHTGEHPARHHPRHGFGPERGAGAVRRREAVGLRHRAIEPAEEGRAAKQPERRMQDRKRAERAGQHTTESADDEGDPTAISARDGAGRQCAGGEAEHVHRQRHGGERNGRRQRRADDRAGRENHRRVGAGQRLRRGQPQHIGARPRVIGDLFGGCDIQHRHSHPAGPGREPY